MRCTDAGWMSVTRQIDNQKRHDRQQLRRDVASRWTSRWMCSAEMMGYEKWELAWELDERVTDKRARVWQCLSATGLALLVLRML